MFLKKPSLLKFSSAIIFLTGRRIALGIIKRLTTREFPTVKWMTTKEFAQWLEDPSKPQPIVLDARSQAEYTVSHLKKAERIDPKDPQLEVVESKDTPIVVYCSVGYRSARIAEWLEQVGFTHVYNLEGSIFQWANEGRIMFKDDCSTIFVHPYNAVWGRLLKSQYRAEVTQVERS